MPLRIGERLFSTPAWGKEPCPDRPMGLLWGFPDNISARYPPSHIHFFTSR